MLSAGSSLIKGRNKKLKTADMVSAGSSLIKGRNKQLSKGCTCGGSSQQLDCKLHPELWLLVRSYVVLVSPLIHRWCLNNIIMESASASIINFWSLCVEKSFAKCQTREPSFLYYLLEGLPLAFNVYM